MKPIAYDLFCGKGGATRGLTAAGFYVIGVDSEPQPDYCGDEFLRADALAAEIDGAAFVWASSPCQEFAKWGMRMFHPDPPYPAEGVRLFEGTRVRLEAAGVPFVMENVRAAEQFVGRCVNHLGPFYLWGSAVPAIFPPELYQVNKGFGAFGKDGVRNGPLAMGSKSKERREFSATVAMIPAELTEYIGSLWLATQRESSQTAQPRR